MQSSDRKVAASFEKDAENNKEFIYVYP